MVAGASEGAEEARTPSPVALGRRAPALGGSSVARQRVWAREEGRAMDQYCILGRIGEGAHGIVFKAKHVEVSRPAWAAQVFQLGFHSFLSVRCIRFPNPGLGLPGVCLSL